MKEGVTIEIVWRVVWELWEFTERGTSPSEFEVRGVRWKQRGWRTRHEEEITWVCCWWDQVLWGWCWRHCQTSGLSFPRGSLSLSGPAKLRSPTSSSCRSSSPSCQCWSSQLLVKREKVLSFHRRWPHTSSVKWCKVQIQIQQIPSELSLLLLVWKTLEIKTDFVPFFVFSCFPIKKDNVDEERMGGDVTDTAGVFGMADGWCRWRKGRDSGIGRTLRVSPPSKCSLWTLILLSGNPILSQLQIPLSSLSSCSSSSCSSYLLTNNRHHGEPTWIRGQVLSFFEYLESTSTFLRSLQMEPLRCYQKRVQKYSSSLSSSSSLVLLLLLLLFFFLFYKLLLSRF